MISYILLLLNVWVTESKRSPTVLRSMLVLVWLLSTFLRISFMLSRSGTLSYFYQKMLIIRNSLPEELSCCLATITHPLFRICLYPLCWRENILPSWELHFSVWSIPIHLLLTWSGLLPSLSFLKIYIASRSSWVWS